MTWYKWYFLWVSRWKGVEDEISQLGAVHRCQIPSASLSARIPRLKPGWSRLREPIASQAAQVNLASYWTGSVLWKATFKHSWQHARASISQQTVKLTSCLECETYSPSSVSSLNIFVNNKFFRLLCLEAKTDTTGQSFHILHMFSSSCHYEIKFSCHYYGIWSRNASWNM